MDRGSKGAAYRELMRCFPTGVTVVTTRDGDVDHGMTANAVTSVSMDPILFSVCVSREARLHGHLERARHFVVNLLGADQADVSTTFAKKGLSDADRWATVPTHESSLGGLRLDGCIGYLECEVVDTFEAGSHTVFLGEVRTIDAGADKPPLVFYGGGYRRLEMSPSGDGLTGSSGRPR